MLLHFLSHLSELSYNLSCLLSQSLNLSSCFLLLFLFYLFLFVCFFVHLFVFGIGGFEHFGFVIFTMETIVVRESSFPLFPSDFLMRFFITGFKGFKPFSVSGCLSSSTHLEFRRIWFLDVILCTLNYTFDFCFFLEISSFSLC